MYLPPTYMQESMQDRDPLEPKREVGDNRTETEEGAEISIDEAKRRYQELWEQRKAAMARFKSVIQQCEFSGIKDPKTLEELRHATNSAFNAYSKMLLSQVHHPEKFPTATEERVRLSEDYGKFEKTIEKIEQSLRTLAKEAELSAQNMANSMFKSGTVLLSADSEPMRLMDVARFCQAAIDGLEYSDSHLKDI